MVDKIKVPPAERLNINRRYTLTIAPAGDNINEQSEKVNGLINQIQCHAKIDLRAEITDIGRRLHYHGDIQFNTYKDIVHVYDIIGNYKRYFQIEIDSITEYWKWYIYCRKGRHLFKNYLTDIGIPYHIRNSPEREGQYITLQDMLRHELDD